MESNPTFLQITTPHYKYELTIHETNKTLQKYTFIVGDKDKPCLEGSITLKNNTNNNRFNSLVNTAKLVKIDALQECSLDDITDEYMATHSFGKELIDSIIFFINSQFPSIKTVSLNDTSYIPCIRDSAETLDLLTYSIALYGKTWYEDKINAYIKPKEKYSEYRKQVEIYASKERKKQLNFIDIYKMIQNERELTNSIFDKNYKEFEEIFNHASTLPEFFRGISKKIDRSQKCRFFKDWLEQFINSQINIDRTWYFDLFPKIEVINRKTKNYTRKNRNTRS